MSGKYRVMSGDSHLEVAPERWTPRVPSQYQSSCPGWSGR